MWRSKTQNRLCLNRSAKWGFYVHTHTQQFNQTVPLVHTTYTVHDMLLSLQGCMCVFTLSLLSLLLTDTNEWISFSRRLCASVYVHPCLCDFLLCNCFVCCSLCVCVRVCVFVCFAVFGTAENYWFWPLCSCSALVQVMKIVLCMCESVCVCSIPTYDSILFLFFHLTISSFVVFPSLVLVFLCLPLSFSSNFFHFSTFSFLFPLPILYTSLFLPF